jgi:hypothetical protein
MTNALISIALAFLAFYRAPDFQSAPVQSREPLSSLSGPANARLAAVFYDENADDSNDGKKGNDPKKNDPPPNPRPPDPPPPQPRPHKPPPPSCHRDDDCDHDGGRGLIWTNESWLGQS